MRVYPILIAVSLWCVACTSEDNGTSVHCFDQQKQLTLPAFTQTNCPTIADTVSNAPPTQTGTAVTP